MSRQGALLLVLAAGFAAALRAGSLPDPTRPDYLAGPARAVVSTPGWRVTAIIISPNRRLAEINGRTVETGDRVGGARVLEINAYSVKLAGPHGMFSAYLVSGDVKRQPATRHGN